MQEKQSNFPIGDAYHDLAHHQGKILSGVMMLMVLVVAYLVLSPVVMTFIGPWGDTPALRYERMLSATATVAAKELGERTDVAHILMEKARADYAQGNVAAALSEAETAITMLSRIIEDGISKYRPHVSYAPAYYERALAYEFTGQLYNARNDLERTIRETDDQTLAEKARLKLAELEKK